MSYRPLNELPEETRKQMLDCLNINYRPEPRHSTKPARSPAAAAKPAASKDTRKKLFNYFTWAVSGIVGAAVLLLGLVYVLPGYDLYFVRSDSMTPVFYAGDLIVTAHPGSFPAGKVEPGTIAAFNLGKETVTHRVVAVDGTTLTTKGDANEAEDSRTAELANVNGIYLFKVPGVGFAANFLKTRNGWFLGIILPTFILLAFIAKDILKEAFRKEVPAAAVSGAPAVNRKTRPGEPKSRFYEEVKNKNPRIRDDPLSGLLREVVKNYEVHDE